MSAINRIKIRVNSFKIEYRTFLYIYNVFLKSCCMRKIDDIKM